MVKTLVVVSDSEKRAIRTLVRREAGCRLNDTFPKVIVVEGCDSPHLCGNRFYWTTPSGKTIVTYPGAYKWPTIYHSSTRYVVVGRGWLEKKVGFVVENL